MKSPPQFPLLNHCDRNLIFYFSFLHTPRHPKPKTLLQYAGRLPTPWPQHLPPAPPQSEERYGGKEGTGLSAESWRAPTQSPLPPSFPYKPGVRACGMPRPPPSPPAPETSLRDRPTSLSSLRPRALPAEPVRDPAQGLNTIDIQLNPMRTYDWALGTVSIKWDDAREFKIMAGVINNYGLIKPPSTSSCYKEMSLRHDPRNTPRRGPTTKAPIAIAKDARALAGGSRNL